MEEKKQQTASDMNHENNSEKDIQIDWLDILRKVISIRKKLYKAAGIGLIIGIIIALSLPRKYTVSVSLSPEMGTDAKVSGGLASLASSFLGGDAMTSGVDALNITLSPNIVSSTPFLLDLFNAQVQDIDGEIDTTLVAYMDVRKKSWLMYVLKAPSIVIKGFKSLFTEENDTISGLNPFQLTEEETEKLENLRNSISAEIDQTTAITTISVTLPDAKVSAIIADSIVKKLQEYIINYRVAKAKDDCIYLEHLYKERQNEYYQAQEKYANYVDANKNVILQSVRTEQERLQNDMNLAFQVYSQVAQQLEVSRAKVQEAKPVFAVVEPATIPLKPSSTSRKVVVLVIIFLSVAGTAGWIIWGKDYFIKFKDGFSK